MARAPDYVLRSGPVGKPIKNESFAGKPLSDNPSRWPSAHAAALTNSGPTFRSKVTDVQLSAAYVPPNLKPRGLPPLSRWAVPPRGRKAPLD